MSILLLDKVADVNYTTGVLVGGNSEPSECRLEEGVYYDRPINDKVSWRHTFLGDLMKLLIVW